MPTCFLSRATAFNIHFFKQVKTPDSKGGVFVLLGELKLPVCIRKNHQSMALMVTTLKDTILKVFLFILGLLVDDDGWTDARAESNQIVIL